MRRHALRRVLRRASDTSGTNLVEAAVITPLLLILTFGIIDFAGLFYAYLALENGASIATRYAVTGNQMDDPDNPGTPLSRVASIKSAMRQATPTLTIDDGAFSFEHMPPGATVFSPGIGGPGDTEKLTISYTYQPLTPILGWFLSGGQIQFGVDSVMKNERY